MHGTVSSVEGAYEYIQRTSQRHATVVREHVACIVCVGVILSMVLASILLPCAPWKRTSVSTVLCGAKIHGRAYIQSCINDRIVCNWFQTDQSMLLVNGQAVDAMLLDNGSCCYSCNLDYFFWIIFTGLMTIGSVWLYQVAWHCILTIGQCMRNSVTVTQTMTSTTQPTFPASPMPVSPLPESPTAQSQSDSHIRFYDEDDEKV